jgi:hypothetical protein
MVPMSNFYRTIFYQITYILSLLSANRIPSCLGSRVDIVSNLHPVFMIFALSLATSAKRLVDNIINVHKNYGGFCIESVLRQAFLVRIVPHKYSSSTERCQANLVEERVHLVSRNGRYIISRL